MRVCSLDSCDRVHLARGFCRRHYEISRKYGSPTGYVGVPRDLSIEAHLRWHGWTETPSGCWEWNGPRMSETPRRAYGKVVRKGVTIVASRLAYETWVGTIPEGHVVRHKCDNPPCINPEHLETGTHADNARDREQRSQPKRLVGAQNPSAKLTPSDVEDIRWLRGLGATFRNIGDAFGVNATTIHAIISGKNWRTDS